MLGKDEEYEKKEQRTAMVDSMRQLHAVGIARARDAADGAAQEIRIDAAVVCLNIASMLHDGMPGALIDRWMEGLRMDLIHETGILFAMMEE